jgi:hypothetical protein
VGGFDWSRSYGATVPRVMAADGRFRGPTGFKGDMETTLPLRGARSRVHFRSGFLAVFPEHPGRWSDVTPTPTP